MGDLLSSLAKGANSVMSQPDAAHSSESDLADDGFGGALDDNGAAGAALDDYQEMEERDLYEKAWLRCVDPLEVATLPAGEARLAGAGVPVLVRGHGYGVKLGVSTVSARGGALRAGFVKASVRLVLPEGGFREGLVVVDHAKCTPVAALVLRRRRDAAGDYVFDVITSRLTKRQLAETRDVASTAGLTPSVLTSGVEPDHVDVDVIEVWERTFGGG